MESEKPYLEETVTTAIRKYNSNYGDNRTCICGHPYYRHFDSYENMDACGCKYCGCREFKESAVVNDGKHRCLCCGSEIEDPHLKVCDKCASEYEF